MEVFEDGSVDKWWVRSMLGYNLWEIVKQKNNKMVDSMND